MSCTSRNRSQGRDKRPIPGTNLQNLDLTIDTDFLRRDFNRQMNYVDKHKKLIAKLLERAQQKSLTY